MLLPYSFQILLGHSDLDGIVGQVPRTYLLLICLSDTISFSKNPEMPSKLLYCSLRFTPNPSRSYPLLFRGGGREVSCFGYVVGAGFSDGVVTYFAGWVVGYFAGWWGS